MYIVKLNVCDSQIDNVKQAIMRNCANNIFIHSLFSVLVERNFINNMDYQKGIYQIVC